MKDKAVYKTVRISINTLNTLEDLAKAKDLLIMSTGEPNISEAIRFCINHVLQEHFKPQE